MDTIVALSDWLPTRPIFDLSSSPPEKSEKAMMPPMIATRMMTLLITKLFFEICVMNSRRATNPMARPPLNWLLMRLLPLGTGRSVTDVEA